MIDSIGRMNNPRRFRGLQVECWEHEGIEAIIALLDRDKEGIWSIRPSSRSVRHISTESTDPTGAGPSRFTLRCRRCEAMRCDSPATVRGDSLDRLLSQLPENVKVSQANAAWDRIIVTRRLLTS